MLEQYKIVCIGASGVGKTSILRRCTDSKFHESIQSTVGLDFMTLRFDVHSETVKLQIFDTAGQQRFSAMNRNYYQKSEAAVLVVSAVDSIPEIWKQVQKYGEEYVNSCQNKNIYLLFNKIDLVDFTQFKKKVVQQNQKISQLQRRYSIKNICFLSAKTSHTSDIKSFFEIITNHLFQLRQQDRSPPPRSYVLGNAERRKSTHKQKPQRKLCCL